MAHVKAVGSKANQGVKVAGKRLGLKLAGGQKAEPGCIIIRQRGSRFHPGKNAKMGRDYTIYAIKPGVVNFRKMVGFKRGQYLVDVL